VKRDKLALINRQWKCKKGKRLTINYCYFVHESRSTRPFRPADGKISPAPGTNQIPGFVEFRPLTNWEWKKKKKSCYDNLRSYWCRYVYIVMWLVWTKLYDLKVTVVVQAHHATELHCLITAKDEIFYAVLDNTGINICHDL